MNKKVKKTISLSQELLEYVVKQSEMYGMSVSSFVCMVISQYRMSKQALDEFSKMQDYINQLKEINETNVSRETIE